MYREQPVWRSLMYVPVNVEKFVDKAHTRGADVIQLDIEDSVPPSEKANARKLVEKNAARVKRGGADVVVRINLGLPSLYSPAAIGERTTVWAMGRFWASTKPPKDCELAMWMKLTKLGDREFAIAEGAGYKIPLIRWPQRLEDECHEFVGAEPGTGIRLLWWLKTKSEARSVSCYGMDCWEHPTHCSGSTFHWGHSESLERDAMMRLL